MKKSVIVGLLAAAFAAVVTIAFCKAAKDLRGEDDFYDDPDEDFGEDDCFVPDGVSAGDAGGEDAGEEEEE